MNIAQIKRFVNNGLTPLNELIGTSNDGVDENTVFASQKKMLISLESIKSAVDGLSNVPSTLSSILSKVNNLDSQKVLGVESTGKLLGNSGQTFLGNGLLIIANGFSLDMGFVAGGVTIELTKGNNIAIPVRGSIFISGYTSGYLSYIWCTYA